MKLLVSKYKIQFSNSWLTFNNHVSTESLYGTNFCFERPDPSARADITRPRVVRDLKCRKLQHQYSLQKIKRQCLRKRKKSKKIQDTMYTQSLHGETSYEYKSFQACIHEPDYMTMSIGCVGKLGHLLIPELLDDHFTYKVFFFMV